MRTCVIIGILWLIPVLSLVTVYGAASGRLPRNGLSGIRLPSTMASDDAWSAGHRAAIPVFWLTVPVTLAGSAALAAAGPEPWKHAVSLTGAALVAVLLAAAVVAGKAARRFGED
jgi:hypothetical protein